METVCLKWPSRSFSFSVVIATLLQISISHFSLFILCHQPLLFTAAANASSFLFLFCKVSLIFVKNQINVRRLPLTSLQDDACCPAGQMHYLTLAGNGGGCCLFATSPTLCMHTAVRAETLRDPLPCHDAIAVATELINPVFPPAFVRKDKADAS